MRRLGHRIPSALRAPVLFPMVASLALAAPPARADDLFHMPPSVETRWITFENPTGEPGAGGRANAGAKGAAFRPVAAGETVVLADVRGSGTIRRIWLTWEDLTPTMLRSCVLRITWDGAERPAVDVPVGDFFGAVFGRAVPFESDLFASPEGRSFNAFVPMPFRTSARVTFTNESDENVATLYYEIDLTTGDDHGEDDLYFHASWRRERPTELGRDFEILPRVEGRGRFLGAHVGVIGRSEDGGWFGEGEVRVYLDGDGDLPTLVGTGTEDWVGDGFGLGEFSHRYQGCWTYDHESRRYAFYRHHVPDPVWFRRAIRVTLQQLGGRAGKRVIETMDAGVPIRPVTARREGRLDRFLERDPPRDPSDEDLLGAQVVYYRSDDVCAVALFYLDRPESGLPPLAPPAERVAGIE